MCHLQEGKLCSAVQKLNSVVKKYYLSIVNGRNILFFSQYTQIGTA